MPEKAAGYLTATSDVSGENPHRGDLRGTAWILALATAAGLLAVAFPVLLSPLSGVGAGPLHAAIAVVSFGLALATLLAALKPVDGLLHLDMLALVTGFAAASTAGLALVMATGVHPPNPAYEDALHHLMGLGAAAGILGASLLTDRKVSVQHTRLQLFAAASGCGVAFAAIALAYHAAFPGTQAGLYTLAGLSAMANLWALRRFADIRRRRDQADIRILMGMAGAGFIADLFMGLHVGDNGTSHLIGCLFRIAAFFLAYRAASFRAFTGPFAELMRETRGAGISDGRIQRLLELSSDWYWEQDDRFRFTRFLTGQTTGILWPIGQTRWQAPNAGVSEQQWAEHRALLRARRPFRDFVLGRDQADGSRRWFSVSGEPVFDAAGKFTGYRGVGKEITPLKHAESALRASEARLKALLEMSVDWYWEQDEQFRFTRMDGPKAPANEYLRENVIGKTRWEIPILNMTAKDWSRHKAELIAHRPFRDMIQQFRGPDGSLRTVRVSGEPVFDDAGKFVGYRGVGRDVTEIQQATDALKAAEARNRSMLDLSVDWYWEQDAAFRFTRIESPAAPVPLGTPGALIGKTRWELPVGGVTDEEWTRHRLLLEARQPFRGFSYKLVEKSGITNWVSVSGEPVFDDAGRFTGYRGIGTYVTGLVTVKEALRESEARFRALLELSSDWYWELDEHLRYRSLSASAPVSAAASLGRQPWELPWTGKSEADWARHRSDLAGHRAFHDFELSIVDGAGGVRWMSLDGEPVFDSTGAFSGYRGVGRNITQERAAQETLRASERMLSLITDNVPAMIAYFDAGLRCRFANPRFARTFGVAHEEVAGRHLHEIVGAQAYADIAGFFGQVLARSEVRFEHRFALPDGQSRYFQTSLVPDRDANGMISGCYALFSDITDYKAVEDQIRRMNLELEHRVQERTRQLMAANKEMEAFSYSVSHDLQAPLRRIERYAELLTESSSGKLDEQGREMLGRIRDATVQTNQLIADVMKLSRISRTDIARTAEDVSLMAREALDHIAAAGTPPRDVRVSIEPGITTDADPALLRILLDNLLGNAWKFTGQVASPAIEVGALDEPHGRGFFVRDNGAGFDMRFAYKLFGAFQRLHGQSEFKGSGIGLAMVQRIVNLHGWQISAEAEPGKGATFRVKTK